MQREHLQINKENTGIPRDKQAKNINNTLKKNATSILKYKKNAMPQRKEKK